MASLIRKVMQLFVLLPFSGRSDEVLECALQLCQTDALLVLPLGCSKLNVLAVVYVSCTTVFRPPERTYMYNLG